jgi:hypothetical protein
MKEKVNDISIFILMFTAFMTTLLVTRQVHYNYFINLFRFIIENAALIFLPFAVLRKKPDRGQILLAAGLIILQVVLRQSTQIILRILFDYRLVLEIVYLVLSVITNFILIYGVYFIQTRKFTKPEKPLFIAMAVYIAVSLIGAIFSTIAASISYGVYNTSEPSIMQIMEIMTRDSAGIYSQLSDFFNGKFVLCLIQTVFVFYLVKTVKKRENTNDLPQNNFAYDPVPE